MSTFSVYKQFFLSFRNYGIPKILTNASCRFIDDASNKKFQSCNRSEYFLGFLMTGYGQFSLFSHNRNCS